MTMLKAFLSRFFDFDAIAAEFVPDAAMAEAESDFVAKMSGHEERLFGVSFSAGGRTAQTAGLVAVSTLFLLASLVRSAGRRDLRLGEVSDAAVARGGGVPTAVLCAFRLSCAVFIFYAIMHDLGTATEKIKFMRCTTFTCWSFVLMGVYFLGSGVASAVALVRRGGSPDVLPASLKAALWVLFEVSTAVSVLICLVSWFVLIPAFKATGNEAGLRIMYSWFGMVAHNANVAMIFAELLANRLPLRASHFPFVPLYGLAYLAFAIWLWHSGGPLYYFFLAHDKPLAFAAYLAILLALGLFFALAKLIADALKAAPGEAPPTAAGAGKKKN